jgi:cell division septal protein FtsQ
MSRAGASRRGLPGSAISAPADRRFRRPDVRPERRRLLRTAGRILRWIAPAVLVLGAAVWLGRVLVASEWLQVQHIVVRGNARLSTAEVEALVADLRRENILSVALDGYHQRLLESPWIERATLARVLPTTIDIEIVERTPMAIARLGRQLYLVDGTGVIIGEYGTQYHDIDLPIVDGLIQSPASRGPLVDPDGAQLTAELAAAFAARPDLGRRLSQIDVSNPRDAVVMLDDDPVWLHLGTERFVERLMTYLDLAPTLYERFEAIDSVDLRFDERVFVRGQGQGQVRQF